MKKVAFFLSVLALSLSACHTEKSPEEIEAALDNMVKEIEEEKAKEQEDNLAQNEECIDTMSKTTEESSAPSVCGTYEFSDDLNTWELTVNADETCTIRNKSKGGDAVCYGSWNDCTYIGHGHRLSFGDLQPKVWFKGDGDYSSLRYPSIDFANMWIYKGESELLSKNPNKRLKLKKIK